METQTLEFKAWPKISRLFRDIVITEKIDGTNACIIIGENGEFATQSRTRIITPENDNFGFAKWALENKEELMKLGPGYHYGEWYGQGIQRNYGLSEKRFMLFNIAKWSDCCVRPKCCEVATVLYTGPFNTLDVEIVLSLLKFSGSIHVQGFTKPEGIVTYHKASNSLFKVTCEKDEEHKGIV